MKTENRQLKRRNCVSIEETNKFKVTQNKNNAYVIQPVTEKTLSPEKKELYSFYESLENWDKCIIQPVITKTPPPIDKDSIFCKFSENSFPKEMVKYYDLVPHDEFLSCLEESWKKALDVIKDEPYRLVYGTQFRNSFKSEHWVAGLLLQKSELNFQPLSPPESSIPASSQSHTRKTKKNWKFPEESNPTKHYVMVDDASYSGRQLEMNLSGVIKNLNTFVGKNSNLNIHIVIPFMSKNAQEIIKKFKDKNENNIKIIAYPSKIIKHYSECITETTLEDHRKELTEKALYMTIFSHKHADGVSLKRAGYALYQGSTAFYSDKSKRQSFISSVKTKLKNSSVKTKLKKE